VERELDRIRLLRRRCEVKDDQINDYRVEIDELHGALREHSRRLRSPYASSRVRDAIKADDARVTSLQGEIRALEADIDKTQDEIAARMDKLNSSDLAYL
jgi:peptidoglycan hydrolase CwlO-like protein